MRSHLLKLSLLVATLVGGVAHADTVYNAATDFSTASNPNGVWSYLYVNNSGPGALTFSNNAFMGHAGLAYWGTASNVYELVGRNTGGQPQGETYNPSADELWLHPGPDAGAAVSVVFTAPTTGYYFISGLFERLDTSDGAGDGVIYSISTSFGGPFDFGVLGTTRPSSQTFGGFGELFAGDSLLFTVSNNANYFNDSTGLKLEITALDASPVPEPSSIALLGTGILGIAGAVRRRLKA